jgi:capsule biosynthesis phosphatase
MNMVIPLCGFGDRFMVQRYHMPKPLVMFQGRPILYYLMDQIVTSAQDGDCVTVIYPKYFDSDHQFRNQLQYYYPSIPFCFVDIIQPTKGALDTVLQGVKQTSTDSPILVLDGDTYYRCDVISQFRHVHGRAAVACFEDESDSTSYSFVQFQSDDGQISDIQEKNRISAFACSGAYFFASKAEFIRIAQIVLADPNYKTRGEYYVSTVIQAYIRGRMLVKAVRIQALDVCCLGTPELLMQHATDNMPSSSPLRICFDLDNTLVTHPTKTGDYTTTKPIPHMVQLVRQLKSEGHVIIIHTARRMKTHGGNVGATMADIGKITFDTLAQFDIPYDELHFGKPYADFYVDDKAVLPNDIHRALGYYHFDAVFTQPRSFNQIVVDPSCKSVMKRSTSNSTKIRAEMQYYSTIPSSVKPMFPKMISRTEEQFTMEYIRGIPLSYLFINEHFTEAMLEKLLQELHYIHQQASNVDSDANLYYPYTVKWQQRLKVVQLLPMSSKLSDVIETTSIHLNEYNRAICGIVHGDPVFSNIFLCTEPMFRFVDVNGALTGEPSIYGDIFYDYAKIYQSLRGYDEIIHNKYVSMKYKSLLMEKFERVMTAQFGAQSMVDIRHICNSLIISMLPLHEQHLDAFCTLLS